MKPSLFYGFKVFVTTAVVAPLIYFLILSLGKHTELDGFDVAWLIITIVYSLAFAIPAATVFHFCIRLMTEKAVKANTQKILLSVLSIVIYILMTFLIDRRPLLLYIQTGFTVTVIAICIMCIWFYRVD